MAEKFKIAYIFIILFLILGACKNNIKPSGVVTTIYPDYLILKEILPVNIPLDYIVKPGMNPHHFTMDMEMAKKISRSKLIILNGFGLDDFIGDKYKNRNIFYMSKFVQPLYSKTLKGNNPHIWLSPVEVLKILPHLEADLLKTFPNDKVKIINRTEKFKAVLIEMIKKLNNDMEPFKNITILSYHPAWGYFARDFSLKKMLYIKMVPNEELSAKEMIRIINKIKGENAKLLLSEINIRDNLIKNLQREIPTMKVVNVDPIGFVINAKKYDDLIMKNEAIIINGLK